MCLLFLISTELLSWKYVEFCQRLFLYLLIWWCGFCPSFSLCVVLHLLICKCCTFLASLKLNLLDYGIWSFECAVRVLKKFFSFIFFLGDLGVWTHCLKPVRQLLYDLSHAANLLCCWILVASILLRIFESMFMKDIGL
jgi:hypothetical protein